ncbi:Serine/threonine protein kinase [Chondromyces apiculatus DSM 436]|uniref:Serine/threonine protein kinase n=1 Tax=Chondromyces apiculatus DSM 436 TaxID=1192034 RepID=A0A017SUF4_9BACT|nr:Serine/threonine protein kinase [Chondromyces apiculatus DSM 436]
MRQGAVCAGRFRIEHRAGAGGMGEVWKALDQATGQPVALKLLAGREHDEPARFAREAQILAALSHPHVVRYVSHGVNDEGAPYLAMEWLEGEDLAQRLLRGPLGVDESVALALDVATTLAVTHAGGVVHRDLKPSNLFLPGGQLDAVKVLDFGIARAIRATRLTRSGTLMGTMGYMAPEQARGEYHLDARVDVFSVGCVLFECLTGRPAFEGSHAAAVLTKVLFEEAPRVRDLRPEVPEVLESLLTRMLAKRREDRPRDGAALAAALRSVQALGDQPTPSSGEPVRAPALTESEQQAVAVILVGAPAALQERNAWETGDPRHGDREAEGSEHGGSAPAAPAAAAPHPPGWRDPDAPTLPLDLDDTLLHEVARHAGAGERLLDGSVVVMMAASTTATDLCAQAARCALALRSHAGNRRIALAMGRSERRGRPEEPAVDRVVRLSADAEKRTLPEGAVVIDEVVAGLLDARFEVHEHEGYALLHGEHPLAEGTRLLLGKPTPCVGRERELDTLRSIFAETVEERTAQAVLITAPPGVGKSRLAQELMRELRGHASAASVWIARGDPLRAGSPFAMLGQALRGACGIREGEPIDGRREKLAAKVSTWIAPPERRRVTDFLGELVGAPFPDDDSPLLHAARRDAQLMAHEVRVAFLDAVTAACAESPLLVLLEDMHWGDRSTVQLLDAALREGSQHPLLVLALARPEVHEAFPGLWEGRRFHGLRLNELSRRAGERLAQHVLGPGADAATIARLVRLSEGNAFYLEELLRWTAEGKGQDVPETVVAMVQSRLGALDEGARRLLRAASISGELFWAGSVAALLGVDSRRDARGRAAARLRAVDAQLAQLVEQEVLVRHPDSRFPDEEELAFRHALLREGAYAMLTDQDRRLGHQLVGEWLEAHGEQDARALAEHFAKGGDGVSAGKHYLRASQQASCAGDGVGSAFLSRRGLALSLPDDLRVRLLGALCETVVWQPEHAATVGREAEELVQRTSRGSAPWVQGMVATLVGASGIDEVTPVVTALAELEPPDIAPDGAEPMVVALGAGMYTLYNLARTREADARAAQIRRIADAFGDHSPFTRIVALVTSSLVGIYGDFSIALELARQSRALARQTGYRRFENIATLHTALNLWALGASAEAESILHSMSMSDAEFGFGSSYRPFILAWILADRGALDEARTHAEQLIQAGCARNLSQTEGHGRWALAEVLRRAHDHERAEREADAALLVLAQRHPVDLPGVLATKAAIHLAQGRPAEALTAVARALPTVEATGTCSQFCRRAFLRLVHVESLEAAGRHEEARHALQRACAEITSLAERIVDPAHRKSFLEDVPENRRTLALSRAWPRGPGEGEGDAAPSPELHSPHR